MRRFIQLVCVLAIAVGSGLVGFANHLEPQVNPLDPATLARYMDSYHERETASIACGVGIGLLVFGTFGLVLPWVNKLGSALTGDLNDNSARTISTVAVWLSMAMILTFGIFRVNWTGTTAMALIFIIVTLICAAAAFATAIVWGWKPWIRTNRSTPEPAPQQGPGVV